MSAAFTKGNILRYMLLPQVMPRMRNLVGTGFWHLAYFMALVFRAANILPPGHPYLTARMHGEYGVRHVLAAAANNIKYDRKHLDQIVLFFAILVGLVILFIQFGLTVVSFLINPASAGGGAGGGGMPKNLSEFFVTQHPSDDIAFRLLDRVFGVKGLFNSADQAKIGQFHEALHGLFQFYSIGLLVIAVLIATYFVAAVLAETAETGTPFGKRFNHVWAPIRLVAAFGLLIPIGQGLNSAQWITLYAAKFGSGFASNGWIKFNEVLGEDSRQLLGDPNKLVGTIEVPEMSHLGQYMMITKTCKVIMEKKHLGANTIYAYLVKSPGEGSAINLAGISYQDALKFFSNGDILIRFGERNEKTYTSFKGYVYPYCGDLILQTTDLKEPGAMKMQEEYFKLIQELWTGNLLSLNTHAENYSKAYAQVTGEKSRDTYAPEDTYKETSNKTLRDRVTKAIKDSVEAQSNSETWRKNEDRLKRWGWAGAGAWYNRVAQINGSLIGAVQNVPRPRTYPSVMEYVYKEKQAQDANIDPMERFKAALSDKREVRFLYLGDEDIARTLYEVYAYWEGDGFRNDTISAHTKLTGNAIIDAINVIFGTNGLFDMCKNTNIHPLAQLSNVGKGMIEASIRNFGFSVATGVAGGIGVFLQPHIGAGLTAASSFFVTVASVGIMIGFILYYVVPFLPFLYFFFAVGGWVKGLFEAMVGVPLWALAHLRIDGEGLPGDAAMGGYYLIFEIFIRPILIIFGLLASVAIFSAMVKVLNETFQLVVSNLSGFNPETTASCTGNASASAPVGSIEYFRGPVDELFFTVIYAIIVYMIGMSSFKLIDLIPNNILRWIGAGVPTFADQAGEPAEGLVQRVAVGGTVMSGQIQGAVSQLASAAGGTAKAAAKDLGTP